MSHRPRFYVVDTRGVGWGGYQKRADADERRDSLRGSGLDALVARPDNRGRISPLLVYVAAALVVASCSAAPAVRPALTSAPVHAVEHRPRHCMRPPPATPEMTGDESIDRHRRDWHLERLIVAYALAYEACRP